MHSTIEQFRDHMLAITARAGAHLAGGTPEGIVELDQCRTEMAAVLLGYSRFVHREIFEPLVRDGSVPAAASAREMKAECICLTEEFRAFTSRWQFADVAGAWLEYQPQATEFRLRIRQHLERVVALSEPALAQSRLKSAA